MKGSGSRVVLGITSLYKLVRARKGNFFPIFFLWAILTAKMSFLYGWIENFECYRVTKRPERKKTHKKQELRKTKRVEKIFENSFRLTTILPLVVWSFDSCCDLLSVSLFIFVHLIVVPRESDHKGLGEWCSNFAIVTIKTSIILRIMEN